MLTLKLNGPKIPLMLNKKTVDNCIMNLQISGRKYDKNLDIFENSLKKDSLDCIF